MISAFGVEHTISKSLPSALRGQLKTGIKPMYAQVSHPQVSPRRMTERIEAARNGQMAAKLPKGSLAHEQWKMSGQLKRGASKTPEWKRWGG